MEKELIRDRIIALCEQELGVVESPPDSNIVKYNDWYYPEGHTYFKNSKPFAWCATAVSYIYHYAGFTLPSIDTELGFHYVPTLYYKAKALKWGTSNPLKGDIVIFDFKSDGKIDHVGIFDKWIDKGKSFTCFEGNTSSNDRGSQSNGGGFFKRVRSVKDVALFVNLIDDKDEKK